MLKHSLSYLRKGVSVIPVRSKDKKPLIDWKEFQKRLATEHEVREWFARWPDANVGIVTGKLSNLAVVDVDEGGSTRGLPPTLIAKTGRGWHFYYRYFEGIENKAGILHKVDIRGEGGFVVAPPSVHASGNQYEWSVIEEPQPFPIEVFGGMQGMTLKTKTDFNEVLKGAEVGTRNDRASKIVGKLISMTDSTQWSTTVWETLCAWNWRLTDPLPEAELRLVFNSITSRERRKQENQDDDHVDLMSTVVKAQFTEEAIVYPTGYGSFDEDLKGGMREGDLVLITGTTGHGKTFFSQSLTYNLAEQKIPTLWFTYEITVQELWEKFLEMGVDDSFMTHTPFKNTSGDITWLKKKIIEARDRFQTKVVFIDHLDFLTKTLKNYDAHISQNFSAYLTSICRELKSIAMQEKIIIILMVHLTKTKEPTMHDIRGSAGIAQEANTVFVVKRQDDDSIIKIEKNRRTGKLTKMTLRKIDGRLQPYLEGFSTQNNTKIFNKKSLW